MDINYIEHKEYLELSMTGDLSKTFEVIESIHSEITKRGFQKILIDALNSSGAPNEFDRFRLGEKMAELFVSKYKIAVITKPEYINKFMENTAVNRGVRLLITGTKEFALKWLLSDN